MTRDYIETRFPDGLYVPSAPDHTRDLETARDYQYGDDTHTLWLHHDLAHTFVMTSLGYDVSPTLRHVAGGERVSDEVRWAEEGVMAEVHRYLNGGPPPTLPAGFARVSGEPDWPARRRAFLALLGGGEDDRRQGWYE